MIRRLPAATMNVVAICVLAPVAFAQHGPLVVKQIPGLSTPGPSTLGPSIPGPGGGGYVRRVGAPNAAATRAILLRTNAAVKAKPKLIVTLMMTVPGIGRVNGAASGNFEPGGSYEITGKGFGPSSPNVFLQVGGRAIRLDVVSWSDGQVFANMPGDISGLADVDHATLNVAPPGQRAFTSRSFGFRAAREDVALAVSEGMATPPPGPLAKTTFKDGYIVVKRTVYDSDGKKCFAEATDTIVWTPPLKRGFQISGYVWNHASDTYSQRGRETSIPRGKYAIEASGDAVKVTFAVMRSYEPPLLLGPGSGSCTSEYRVQPVVTGPRGVSPL